MAWTASKIFRAYLKDVFDNTTALDLGSDAFKAALYNNSITPDQNATSANTAYNVGQWATAQEVYQAGQWAQAGVALSGVTLDAGTTDVVFMDATDTPSGSAATLTNIYGAQIYDTTVATPVASQGICFNYYGGPNTVTNGTFTSVWNALGLLRVTIT
jgi:hypothetical protein